MSSQRQLNNFGKKLRYLRLQHDMTLQELTQALGHTAHGYISELEAGKKKPTAILVLKVADLFSVSTDQLLKDELEISTKSDYR